MVYRIWEIIIHNAALKTLNLSNFDFGTLYIGVGRFRILGRGARFRILGGKGGHFQQEHDVVTTSMRRNNVASTSFRRHVLTRFLINQCK